VDLAEASAGGGTIASLSDARTLQVGPQSAGADPGPACYGKANLATVTDANVLLGRLRNDALLGGTFPIDAQRSEAAIGTIASETGMSTVEAATGIIRLIDHDMAKIVRIVTVERGLDPRDFTLLAFGGNGPLHSCAVADELGIRSVLVPPSPGLFSAFGLIVAPLKSAVALPLLRHASDYHDEELSASFGGLRKRALAELDPIIRRDRSAFEAPRFVETADIRYHGQSYELNILAKPTLAETVAAFHQAHADAYGYSVAEEPVEIVNLRVTAMAPRKTQVYRFEAHPIERPLGLRRLWASDAWHDVPVLERAALREGIKGPAIIDEYDGTTLIPPRWSATLHNDVIRLQANDASSP
ncbi:MAG: hydantoinase/oxoprolinase family protein, partial [Candidatus Eremiobacteraeota bacterium]|nr:hydantoinase/oxoprolinase family protein [Candidatus Eremiobacteraeota bacterium]